MKIKQVKLRINRMRSLNRKIVINSRMSQSNSHTATTAEMIWALGVNFITYVSCYVDLRV